jgi:hypothetical protein
MVGIPLKKMKCSGAIDVHNRVTLVNDIVSGRNRSLRKCIDCSAAMHWNKTKFNCSKMRKRKRLLN